MLRLCVMNDHLLTILVSSQKPCLEPHCVVLAASILSSLDVTQDPCENFYDFASEFRDIIKHLAYHNELLS